MEYDFCGWATRNNIKCSDGRTIMRDAFKHCNGKTVPIVWNHQHDDPFSVLGQGLLENRDEGMYIYGKFNDTESGRNAKILVHSGDITHLSICANKLQQRNGYVMHGTIREVSLVLAGANPGAYIESTMMHADDPESEEIVFSFIDDSTAIEHADKEEKKENEPMAEEKKAPAKSEDEETVADVFNTLTEKQKTVVYALIGQALESRGDGDDEDDDDENEDGGKKEMKHNVFDNDSRMETDVICHADQEEILRCAKSSQVGSLQAALEIYAAENDILQHDATATGFDASNIGLLFPEYKDVRPGAPELLTNDQGWIGVVMRKVHKSPISRIRTGQVDIRRIDALRAKGYKKGKQKTLTGNYNLVRRTTDPQTVYVKNALHRDDITDITDFDYVKYMYDIDRMMLNEELATAIMLGDGREDGDPDKISPEHIRPIWLDDDLYTIHVDLDVTAMRTELQGTNTGANFGNNYVYAESLINTMLYARERYKGSGTPDLYCTPHILNVMLLARDMNGRRIYSSKSELASALNVGEIHTAEQFADKTRTTTNNQTKKLLGLVVNLTDYSLGATKGGEVSHFTQFDIDFNQEKSLIETRCSGALTRVYSAIAIEEPVAASTTPTPVEEDPEDNG